MEYKDYNDNELLWYVAEKNEAALDILYKKYEPFIINFAKKMFEYCKYSGLEMNDLVQEGMLGLNDAITKFNDQKNVTFYTFAKTCIERKIISCVVSTRRLKHRILNESISYETDLKDDGGTLEYLLRDNKHNPESMLLHTENEKKIIELTKESLTDFEQQVFELKISNFSYKEIAEILDKDKKSIDNALQRIKTKMKKILNTIDE